VIDAFWDAILSSGSGASGASGACNTLQQNSQGYTPIGDEKIICNGINAPLAPLTPPGADPYDTAERHAIQQEGNEISDLPDKPLLSLAEQAALVLDGYNGDRDRAAADLRTVAHNFVLAAYLEAGTTDRGFEETPDLTPSEHGALHHPQSPTPAQSTTAATPALSVQPEPDMTPSRVSCGTCLHFLPDTIHPAQGVGRCGVTGAGPPSGGSGYKACYPMAPRTCPSYERNET